MHAYRIRSSEPDVESFEMPSGRTVDVICLVVAEDWPAWLPGVLSMRSKTEPLIFCGSQAFQEKFGGKALPDVKDGSASGELDANWEKAKWVFVSGSLSFVKELLHVGRDREKVLAALNLLPDIKTTPEITGLRWERLSHAELGGATSSRPWIGLSIQLAINPREGERKPQRRLRDYLSPVEGGRPISLDRSKTSMDLIADRALMLRPFDALHPGGLFLVRNKLSQVIAATVFHQKSGCDWVIRFPTIKELWQLWDLPIAWRDKLEVKAWDLQSLPFMQVSPSKILRAVIDRLVQAADPLMTDHADTFAGSGKFGWVPWIEYDADKGTTKATKGDEEKVRVSIWDDHFEAGWSGMFSKPQGPEALETLRSAFFLPIWRRRLTRSIMHFLNREDESLSKTKTDALWEMEWEVARDCVQRASDATWWEWSGGSTLFFWRWPREFRFQALNGIKFYITRSLPRRMTPVRPEKDPRVFELLKGKLDKIVTRRYISRNGPVRNLSSYFAVPKGEDDIRTVFDCSACGLNDCLWSPTFGLPTVHSVVAYIGVDSFCGDLDIGEMFLNFPLDPAIRPFAGIDIRPYETREGNDENANVGYHSWNRLLFGCKPSPYNSVRSMIWAEDVVRGDRLDVNNPLRWDTVRLNLPGSENYNPSSPWLSKWVANDSSEEMVLASDFKTYVDDVRPFGTGEEECYKTVRWIAGHLQYLGIQDAPRKRRSPSQSPGAWAGAIVRIGEFGVGVSISQDKWDKTKRILQRILDELRSKPELDRKQLESDRGFLVYVMRTFRSMAPYLKGIHLTLDGWRPNRDESGWPVPGWMNNVAASEDEPEVFDLYQRSIVTEGPKAVRAVPRLKDDLEALQILTESDSPPTLVVRPKKLVLLSYGFGDASGAGFGSSIEAAHKIKIRVGVWGSDCEGSSSNFRELRNLVEALEELWLSGELTGAEVFLFTDNSTSEAAFFRATSSSPRLFELVLRLRKLELSGGVKLHLIHCAGTRMIAQGSDGLSRGDMDEGVMAGGRMIDFIPLHLSAFERGQGDSLLTWIRRWTGKQDLLPLGPEEWFTKGHDITGGARNKDGVWIPRYDEGIHLWAPPPAIADLVVEELRRARHRRQCSFHIFVCPRLMTYAWRKMLFKDADFVFTLHPGHPYWPKEMHEPLIFALLLPYIRSKPWAFKGTPRMVDMGRKLQKLLDTNCQSSWIILRKLLELPRQLASVPECVVRQVLFFGQQVKVPREQAGG